MLAGIGGTFERFAMSDFSLVARILPKSSHLSAPAEAAFLWDVSRPELHRQRIATLLSGICSQFQPLVGFPVHTLWLGRKWLVETAAATKAHPEILRLAQRPIVRALLLACINKLEATPAREQFVSEIEFCDPAAAISTIGIN